LKNDAIIRPDPTRLGEPILDLARQALLESLGEAHAGKGRLLLKWCALFHDVGKPGVRSMSADGRIHVMGHPEYGLQLLEGHIATWFPKQGDRDDDDEEDDDRLRHLILRHHDHNNLAKEDHQAVLNLDVLRRFTLDPISATYKEFETRWGLVESVILRDAEGVADPRSPGERRRDFPLLILHGFADSLASRGHRRPLPLGRRAEIYLVFLALWHRRDALASIHRQWWLCRDRTREKVNPDLHRLVFPNGRVTDDRQKLLGQLPEWAWGRVQANGKCPEPEEFVEEARRRLEEMSSSMVMMDEPRSPVPGAAGSP
jgi:HD domain